MVVASNLGFPYIGARRELKKLIEGYFSGKVTENELSSGAKSMRAANWKLQFDRGIAVIPSNDFSFYDRVLDNSIMFGVIPQKYQALKPGFEQYFAMARGLQRSAAEGVPAVDVPALEMKKWFDTNYHYLVPEFKSGQEFKVAENPKIIEEFLEAKKLGFNTRPVLIGPISYLLLGKPADLASDYDSKTVLPGLLEAYCGLLKQLRQVGAEWLQIEEPFLAMDLSGEAKEAFVFAYQKLREGCADKLKLLLTTYFSYVGDNLELMVGLPVDGFHLDLVRYPEQLEQILPVMPKQCVLSLGVVNGRNVRKTNLESALKIVEKALPKVGKERLYVAPSCSLLHSPLALANEKKMDPEIKDWLSFAVEKLEEIVTLAKAAQYGRESVKAALEANMESIGRWQSSARAHNPDVQRRLKEVAPDMFKRVSSFDVRGKLQQAKLQLPMFPTTTIGSFPQTTAVRQARLKRKKGDWTAEQYDKFVKEEIARCVHLQESLGLDVLVHGECERNDMVEFFGENLDGYVFSENGWITSYGTRAVKPPIIYGDVSRSKPMTVDVIKYAQSLTSKPMKGMLTGPVTCLQWSLVRDDIPKREISLQLALAIRDEVQDLEKAGIKVIQIDEAALREGLPLRRKEWDGYLQWAVDSFLLASTGVRDETQIHTHMCYSDFNDIFPSIKRMDADVITIENSRSNLKLLNAFKTFSYSNWIGPGIYDIHSPRVPSVLEMKERLLETLRVLPPGLLWINPDCGLKTRGVEEVVAALTNLVEVANQLRSQFKQ